MDNPEKKPAASPGDRFQKSSSVSSKQTSNISDQNHRQDKLHDPPPCGRPTYALKLRAEPGVNAIHALRAVLKTMLRRYGLRCISANEEKSGGDGQ
jgi:hypothetical protein